MKKKMKLFWLLAFLMPIATSTTAQSKDFYLEADLFYPGLRAEYNFSPKHSISAELRYVPVAGSIDKKYSIYHFINANLNYRYYYNYNKRLARGEDVSRNNNNYLFAGLHTYTNIAETSETPIMTSSVIRMGWGFKRYFGQSNWYYGAEVGGGYFLSKEATRPAYAPYFAIKVGYQLYHNNRSKLRETK